MQSVSPEEYIQMHMLIMDSMSSSLASISHSLLAIGWLLVAYMLLQGLSAALPVFRRWRARRRFLREAEYLDRMRATHYPGPLGLGGAQQDRDPR